MSIYEYDQEKHIRMERQDVWEDGMQEGVLRRRQASIMSKKKGIQPGLRSLSKIEKTILSLQVSPMGNRGVKPPGILTVRNSKGRIICDRSH